MPTLQHNALVEMFRENPGLAPHLLSTLFHLDVPPHASAAPAEASLDQLLPVEFRADLVLEFKDANGVPVLAIVLEAQRDVDPNKLYSWPVYVAVARATKRCPAVVLVVAPDPAVAAWAGQEIDMGLRQGVQHPLVLGPDSVPRVTDPAAASRETELAVLSAVAHGNGPAGLAVVQAALAALGGLDREHAAAYFHVIWEALREPVRQALEALVMAQQTQGKAALEYPPFLQRLIDRGFREGELAGKLEGKLEGEIMGKLEGKRDALLQLLGRAGIALTDDERARVQGCTEVPTLDRWIGNVLGAKTAVDVLS